MAKILSPIFASFSSKHTARLLYSICMCIPLVKALRSSVGKKHVNFCFIYCFLTLLIMLLCLTMNSWTICWRFGEQAFCWISYDKMTITQPQFVKLDILENDSLQMFLKRKMILSFPHPSSESYLDFLSRFYDRWSGIFWVDWCCQCQTWRSRGKWSMPMCALVLALINSYS